MLSITRMITDRIGLHSVLLPLLILIILLIPLWNGSEISVIYISEFTRICCSHQKQYLQHFLTWSALSSTLMQLELAAQINWTLFNEPLAAAKCSGVRPSVSLK